MEESQVDSSVLLRARLVHRSFEVPAVAEQGRHVVLGFFPNAWSIVFRLAICSTTAQAQVR